jgi:hypothetical protein
LDLLKLHLFVLDLSLQGVSLASSKIGILLRYLCFLFGLLELSFQRAPLARGKIGILLC